MHSAIVIDNIFTSIIKDDPVASIIIDESVTIFLFYIFIVWMIPMNTKTFIYIRGKLIILL